jgi:DNA transformation protein and related proteins
MGVTKEFTVFIEDQLRNFGPIRIRNMFGGAGIYHNDLMFGLIADDTLYFKADKQTAQDYIAQEMAQFKPFADKSMRMSYWEVPGEILEDEEELTRWANKSFKVALLTKKSKKKVRTTTKQVKNRTKKTKKSKKQSKKSNKQLKTS